MPFDQQFISEAIARAARVITSLDARRDTIEAIGLAVRDRLRAGGRVYTCGNGGSAAEALHLAEELIGKYKRDRPPLAGICLNADPTALTCIANDFGFEVVFERQVRALLTSTDALVVFSTSGNSPNIIRALKAARQSGATTIGLLGKGGGEAASCCDHVLVIDSDQTERIQEAHQLVLHLILEAVEA